MNYNDISEIRESANAYVIDIGNAVSHNMADPVAISASAKRLHDAITTFDFKELPRVLDGISARSLLVRPGFSDIIKTAKKLQSFCDTWRTKIKAYDPDVLQVALFCNEFVPLMEGAIEKLKERVENEPTEEDIQSAQIIRDYLSGLYPDKTFPEVLHGCVFFAADDRTLQRRGKYLAAVFNGVSHDGLPVSDEIMSYVAEQLRKRAALGSIKDIVMRNEAKKKAASTTTPASTPEPQPTPLVEATTKDDAPTIDADRLGPFFNAKFKGSGNNYNHFADLVKDIRTIKVAKELAMIAVMIYNCRQYFIQRPSTFAAWLRDFFDIIGRDCPKDTRKSKYKPNDTIKRMFIYLE